MIEHGRWIEHGTRKMLLIGDGGKIVAEITCVDYPMIWVFKNDRYISEQAAKEAAQKFIKQAEIG